MAAWGRDKTLPVVPSHSGVRARVAKVVMLRNSHTDERVADELRKLAQQGNSKERAAAEKALRQLRRPPSRVTLPGQKLLPGLPQFFAKQKKIKRAAEKKAEKVAAALRKKALMEEPKDPAPDTADRRAGPLFDRYYGENNSYDYGEARDTAESVAAVVGECGERLSLKWGIKPGKILGCGLQGCAVQNKVKAKSVAVLKFTTDPAEAKLAAVIAEKGRGISMLPRIKHVLDLKKCAPEKSTDGGYRDWWVIVREDIPGGVDDGDYCFSDAVRIINEAAGYAAGARVEEAARIAAQFERRAKSNYSDSDNCAAKIIKPARALVKWAIENQVDLGPDMHNQNIGIRADGSYAIRDLGFTNTRERGKIYLAGLKGKRRRG